VKFSDISRYTEIGSYYVNVGWDYLEEHLERDFARDGSASLDIYPDFQRGHVWTNEQRSAYVEYCLRGGVGGRDLYFNCVGWMCDFRGPFVLVDGLQRLTAVRMFLRDELVVMGSIFSEFEGRMNQFHCQFVFHVNDLPSRADVLKWYLEINAGGVIHSREELDRVQALLDKELCDEKRNS